MHFSISVLKKKTVSLQQLSVLHELANKINWTTADIRRDRRTTQILRRHQEKQKRNIAGG